MKRFLPHHSFWKMHAYFRKEKIGKKIVGMG
jgi:hypothetical protein